MNRQLMIIGAAIAAIVLAVVGYLLLRPGTDLPSADVAPITGPERAEEARGVIADLERARQSSSQPAARATGEVARTTTAEPAAAPSAEPAGGAGAELPEPTPAAPTGASDLDVAFERARAFQRDGQLADAQLLYFYGARAGHGPSAFELAAMNDPNHHSAQTSLLEEPDAFQAYRWYSVAREQGVAGAVERLDALRAWAVEASESGDFDAEQLLLQWE